MAAKFSRSWPRAAAAAGCLAGVTFLTACGTGVVVRNGQTLAVSVGEYRVTPQSVAAPSGLLALQVHNNGRFVHDLTISRDGIVEAQTAPLAPGQGATLDAVLAPGTYVMASTVLSDQALGAYGTLRIDR